MGTRAWELMATTPAFSTSKRASGTASSSIAWRKRASPNVGSGSPWAADSPITITRTVRGGFSSGMTKGVGWRASAAGKKRSGKSGLGHAASRPRTSQETVKDVGWPTPSSGSSSSRPPRSTSGARTTDTARKSRSRPGDGAASLRERERSRERCGATIGSEERVDERSDGAALGEHDDHPEQEQHHHQREQPPLLLLAEELEVLAEAAELGHGPEETSTSARTVPSSRARAVPSS